MMRSLRPFRVTDSNQRLLEQLLKIRLPNVNDVVDVRRATVRRVVGHAVRAARRPEWTLRPLGEHAILKVAAEQSEFPELIRDVLADIGDDAVRANDDFLTLFLVVLAVALVTCSLGAGFLGVGSRLQ